MTVYTVMQHNKTILSSAIHFVTWYEGVHLKEGRHGISYEAQIHPASGVPNHAAQVNFLFIQ